MNIIKKTYSYLFGTKQTDEKTGTEDIKHVTEITKKRKKRVKTEARKLKERIKKKQKKRQQRNEKRIQYNRENNIKFGYESPPEYILDETTNEDTYYSAKQEAAENYKNKVIHKTDMTAKEFYRELEEKEGKKEEKGNTESESESETESETESESSESQ